MREELDHREVRILGCLIEKELTTPDYYPLTLNSLTAACNQKSNRNPVVIFPESDVECSLEALRDKGWVVVVDGAGSRTRKYRHSFLEKSGLEKREMVVLAVLMLRGAQTVGEIRGRSGRMHRFESLDEVGDILDALAAAGEPWVVRLPRLPGRKENRYMHLLAGEVEVAEEGHDTFHVAARDDGVALLAERLDRTCGELKELRDELAALKEEFARFRAQFE